MSMAMTLRAILESGNVNQPSPQHRSTTSLPGVTPTSLSTLAGSGHRASHQPGSGNPVVRKILEAGWSYRGDFNATAAIASIYEMSAFGT